MIQNQIIDKDLFKDINQQISDNIDKNNDKVSLLNYKSFDYGVVLSEIDQYYEKVCSLENIHKELLHISRNITIPDKYLNHILDYLQLENQDYKVTLTYCQILKNSIIKGSQIEIEKLITIFKVIRDKDSQLQLVSIFSMIQQKKLLQFEDLQKILIQNDLFFGEIRDSLMKLNQISDSKNKEDSNYLQQFMFEQEKACFKDVMLTVESHFNHQRISDYEDYQQISLIHQFHQQNEMNIQNQVLRNVIDNGLILSQRNKPLNTILKSTYETVKQIYQYAYIHKEIEQQDKDDYLPSKLLGSKYFSNGVLGEFLCDRMIIETFRIISEKQSLNKTTIEKLFLLCQDTENVKNLFVKDVSEGVYVNLIHRSEINMENLNTIEEIAKKILQVFYKFDDVHSKISINHSVLIGNVSLNCFGNKNGEVIDKVIQIMLSEFQKIRVSAITIIHNLVSKGFIFLNEQQMNIIKQLQFQDEQNQQFREVALKIYIQTLENNLQELFDVCIKKIEKNHFEGIEQILNHILTEDSAQLLVGDNIQLIITKINSDTKQIQPEIKNKLAQIVSKFLSFDNLNIEYDYFDQLFRIFLNSTDLQDQLKFNLLKSIIYYLKKNHNYQEDKYNQLINNLDKYEDLLQNLIILSLGTILNIGSKIKITISDCLSKKLLIPLQNNSNGSKITNDPNVSLIVAEIIYNQVNNYNIELSDTVINNLISILDDQYQYQDQKIKLYSTKILTKINISKDNCDKLIQYLFQILTNDYQEQLVIYSLLYTKVILIIQIPDIIELKYIELLAKIYNWDDYYQNEIVDTMQENIIKILINLTKQQQYIPIQFYSQFEIIFSNDFKMQQDVIKIFKEYINYEKIPENMIEILEIQSSKFELQEDCFIILELAIRKGYRVSDSTLQKFIAKISNRDKDSDKYYEILDIAEINYSLSEHIFTLIQLERAGKAIQLQSNDYIHAIEYIYQKVQEGQFISNNIFYIIANKLDDANNKLIKILECVSSNNQTIPNIVVNQLQKILNTQVVNQNVMLIFINMLKNNQEFSKEIILKLEEMLDNQIIPELIVQFFAIPSQNCKLFSSQLIERLCNHIKKTDDLNLELSLLQAINTKINANKLFHQDDQHINLINQVLISKLQLSKQTLIPISLKIINYIQLNHHSLNTQLQDKLITLIYEKEIKYEIKTEISKILNQYSLDVQTTQFIKQFLLSQDSKINNLLTKSDNNRQIELLPETLDQINQILQECKDHQLLQQTLSLLNNCKNKDQIPVDVIQNIVIFISYKDLRSECFKLINQIAESQKSLPTSILTFLIDNYSDDLESLSFLQEGNNVINDKLEIIKQLNQQINLENSNYTTNLLKNINATMKSGLQLSEQKILLFCNLFQQGLNQDQIYIYSKILSKLVLNQSNFDKKLVEQVEKIIKRNDIKITNQIIKAYIKIIESQKYQDLQICIGSLLNRKLETKYLFVLNQCVSYACQFGDKLEQNWLNILEINLLNKSVIVSDLSFKGLKIAIQKGLNSEVFRKYCQIIFQLLQIMKQSIQINYDLIEAINCLQQYDLAETFSKCIDWHIGLLENGFEIKNEGCKISKIKNKIEKNQINNEQYIQFLKTIIYIEKLTIMQFDDLIIIINSIGLQNTIQLLKQNINYNNKQSKVELNWLKLVQGWLTQMMIDKIKNELFNSPYILILTDRISKYLSKEQSAYLFEQLREIGSFQEFQLLLEFINVNKCQIKKSTHKYTVKELQQYFEIELIISQFPTYQNDNNLQNIVKELLMFGWTYQKFKEILNKGLSKNQDIKRENSLVQFFKTLCYYKIQPKYDLEGIFNQRESNWNQLVFNFALIDIENKAGAKNIETLIDELKELNENNLNQDNYLDIIKSIYDKSEQLSNWELDDIKQWVKVAKEQQKEQFKKIEFIIESLAVIKKAILINFQELNLTCSQIMSALILLLQGEEKGVLLQVRTGEGKSIIISIIAIFYGLQGIPINIHTSSSVLAERDSNRMASLYKIFDLECAENSDKQKYIKNVKQCYKKHIVYGDVSQFQFDYLRHHHSQLNTMGLRKLEMAIVDEVDSMLIDESSKFARLSTTIAGIDHFQPIYIIIWQRIKMLEKQIIRIDSKYYYVNGNIVSNNLSSSLQILDSERNLYQIENLEQLVQMNQSDILKEIGQIVNNLDEFITNDLMEYVKGVMNQNEFIILPKYFTEYLELQLPNWICSAQQAMKFQENVHYIISEGQIKPVDFQNTGIIQNSTYWGNGLHQFLQIKHNLKITNETFLTNFLSNVGYFKKYNKRLFGLTGTLGSQKAQQMLTKVYDVSLVFIPQNNYKLFKELPLIVTADNIKWVREIINSAISECNRRRGVLIICETIFDARKIYEKLQSEYNRDMIKLYDMNNKFLEKDIEIINPSQIFVATNLAGRGTDIKTNKIETYGGLHVILTFLPSNQRIEEQAFGRTARLKNRGTGQIIINEYQIKHLNCDQNEYSQLKYKRDQVEAKRLQKYLENNLKVIELKELYFEKFCSLLNELRVNIQSKKLLTKLERYYTFLSIDEKWAIFLLQNQFKEFENFEEKFKEFEKNVKELYENDKIICNPYYKIDILKSKLKKQSLQNNKDAFNQIIITDGDQLAIIYEELAYLHLQMDNQDKNQALKNFYKTVEILSKEVAQWQSLYVSLSKYLENFQDSGLQLQIKQKLQIIEIYANSIEANIKVVKKSQRLIDIVVKSNNEIKNIQTKIIYQGLEQKDAKKLCFGANTFHLVFNDLSYYQDYIDQDSAVKTIENIRQLDQSFNNQITLKLNEIVASKLNILYYQNDIKMGFYKQFALDYLKESKKVTKILIKTPEKIQESNTIQNAIQIVEEMSDDICIDLIFMNEESKKWQTELQNNSQLDIEIIDLDKENVKQEIQILKSDSINLIITSDIEDLQKITEEDYITEVKHLKKQIHVYYKKEEAKRIFQSIKNNNNIIQTISIPNIKPEDINKVLNICKDKARFNLQFNKINSFYWIGRNQLINIRFTVNNIDWSKNLIKQLRKLQLEFQLIFRNLNSNQTLDYIQIADIQQQSVKKVKKKKLMEFNQSKILNDLQEFLNFELRGIKDIIILNENKFFPLQNMLILGTMAFSQFIVGGLLVATGLGGFIGNIFLQESVSDIINLIASCYKREFSWSDYCYQKAASILCTILTFGFKVIQDVSKAKTLFEGINQLKIKNVLEINSILKEAWKQPIQLFALRGSNYVLTKIVSTILENTKSYMQNYFLNFMTQVFSKEDTIRLLRKINVLNYIQKRNLADDIKKFFKDWLKNIGFINHFYLLISNLCIKSAVNKNLEFESWIQNFSFKILQGTMMNLFLKKIIVILHDKFKQKLINLTKFEYNLQFTYQKWSNERKSQTEQIEDVQQYLNALFETQDDIDEKTYFQINEELKLNLVENQIPEQIQNFFSYLTKLETEQESKQQDDELQVKIIPEIAQELTQNIFCQIEQQILLPWISCGTFQLVEKVVSIFTSEVENQQQTENYPPQNDHQHQNEYHQHEKQHQQVQKAYYQVYKEEHQQQKEENHQQQNQIQLNSYVKEYTIQLSDLIQGVQKCEVYLNYSVCEIDNLKETYSQKQDLSNNQTNCTSNYSEPIQSGEDDTKWFQNPWYIGLAAGISIPTLILFVIKSLYKKNPKITDQ